MRIEHVRSHTMVPGNELADRLAEMGRSLGPYDPDVGVAEAQRAMATIALAANSRGHRRNTAATTPPPTNQRTPDQPFTIYQTSQPSDANQTNQPPNDDRMIRDDG